MTLQEAVGAQNLGDFESPGEDVMTLQEEIQPPAPAETLELEKMTHEDLIDVQVQIEGRVAGPLPKGSPKIKDQEALIRGLYRRESGEETLPGDMVPAPYLSEDPGWETQPEENKRFLRALEKTGRVAKAAKSAGMSRGAFVWRRKQNKAFDKLWTLALDNRAEIIEDEAIRRAVTGVKKDIYYMGRVCGQERVYSDSLLAKLLEGNMPQKYRTSHKVEVEGGALGVGVLVLPAVTTAEEWAAQNSGLIIDQEPEDEYAS
jgi:hypothetical protein